jgi:hypothetical protein
MGRVDGDDQTINLAGVGDNAFHPSQRAALDVHLGADLEKRPRLRYKPGAKDGPNGLNLFLINGNGGLAGADDAYHAGGSQNGQALPHIKSREQITWEKWDFELFHPVGPTTPTAIQR